MDIYWIKDKKRLGPEPEVVIISMFQRGELSLDTLAWHKGCSGWVPLEELPALSSYFKGKKDSEQGGESNEATGAESGAPEAGSEIKVIMMMSPNPYVRLLARLADLFIYYCVAFSVLFICSPESVKALYKPEEVNTLYIIIVSYGWIPLEALCLRLFGTTLGKWIMGIQVFSLYQIGPWKGEAEVPVRENSSGRGNLTFMQSLIRTLFVYAFGLGFLLNPLLTGIAGLFSFFIVRKTGTTMWDGNARTVEIYRGFRPWDIVILIAVMIFASVVFSQVALSVSPEFQQHIMNMVKEFYNLPVK